MKRGDDTRDRILDKALDLARTGGIAAVSARAVSEAIGRAHTGIRYYFPGEGALRRAVISAAIERRDAVIIARLILDRHPAIDHLTLPERQKYLSDAAAG